VQDFACSLICESDPVPFDKTISYRNYDALDGARDWPEAELAVLRQVLRRLTSLRVDNPEDAEDLVQETLLTLVRRGPKMVEKGTMLWAMGILRRKVGNYYRRTQRFSVQDAQIRYLIRGRALAPSPESCLHHAELMNVVAGVLVNLTPQERAPVDLYLAGRQTAEIVSMLRPERYQNIVNRLHRARKKLVVELTRHGYEKRRTRRRRRNKGERRMMSRII
jgi:RNA polymerase sigma factor (sigma-70 family)